MTGRRLLTTLALAWLAACDYAKEQDVKRLSGDDGSWYRMNRTFLTELRQQFLQWRTLTPQRMMQYVEESRRLFATVDQPVPATIEPIATPQPV